MQSALSVSVRSSISARTQLRGSYGRSITCQKGFDSSKKGNKRQRFNQLEKGVVLDPSRGWAPLMSTSDFSAVKDTCPVITSDGIALVLYRVKGRYYCSDASSTAYKFPMSDANIFERPDGPAAECPLDGTTYDLQTGKDGEFDEMSCRQKIPLSLTESYINGSKEQNDICIGPCIICVAHISYGPRVQHRAVQVANMGHHSLVQSRKLNCVEPVASENSPQILKVLEWCPKTNPLRTLLGALKSKEEPKPLSVYDVVLADDGMLYAKLF